MQQLTVEHAPVPQPREETVEAVRLIPRERVQQPTAEQIEDVPQLREETVGAVKLVPQERVQQRVVEHEPVPQILQETVEVVLIPQERVQQRVVEHEPVPQILQETVEVVLIPHERVQQRTVDAPKVLEETVVVVAVIPFGKLQQRTGEQVVDVPQSPERDCHCRSRTNRGAESGHSSAASSHRSRGH